MEDGPGHLAATDKRHLTGCSSLGLASLEQNSVVPTAPSRIQQHCMSMLDGTFDGPAHHEHREAQKGHGAFVVFVKACGLSVSLGCSSNFLDDTKMVLTAQHAAITSAFAGTA